MKTMELQCVKLIISFEWKKEQKHSKYNTFIMDRKFNKNQANYILKHCCNIFSLLYSSLSELLMRAVHNLFTTIKFLNSKKNSNSTFNYFYIRIYFSFLLQLYNDRYYVDFVSYNIETKIDTILIQ